MPKKFLSLEEHEHAGRFLDLERLMTTERLNRLRVERTRFDGATAMTPEVITLVVTLNNAIIKAVARIAVLDSKREMHLDGITALRAAAERRDRRVIRASGLVVVNGG